MKFFAGLLLGIIIPVGALVTYYLVRKSKAESDGSLDGDMPFMPMSPAAISPSIEASLADPTGDLAAPDIVREEPPVETFAEAATGEQILPTNSGEIPTTDEPVIAAPVSRMKSIFGYDYVPSSDVDAIAPKYYNLEQQADNN